MVGSILRRSAMDNMPALPSMEAEDARLGQLIARMKVRSAQALAVALTEGWRCATQTLEDHNSAEDLGPEFQQAMLEVRLVWCTRSTRPDRAP